MGHTNSTANLSLPQFIGSDKPTWLGDVNGAFSAIDAYAGTNDAAVSAAASAAANAVADASNAVNTANTANTTAGNASSTATAANTVAGQALTIANSTDTKVGALIDLDTVDKTSIVRAINEVRSGVVLATAAANQTYAQQLDDISAAFGVLSDQLRSRCILKVENAIYHVSDIGGLFTKTLCDATTAYITTLKVNTHQALEYTSAGSVTEFSSATNSETMQLIML